MSRSTPIFPKIPWTGGVNTSVDQGVIPDNDLIVADNVVFSSTTARLKREGMDRFDSASDLPAPSTRASSGTTRTIVFASALQPTSPDIYKLVVGENITITSTNSAESTEYTGTYPVDSITASTITYTHGETVSESTTAVSSDFVIKRRPYIDVKDFWYTTASGIKERLVCAMTDQGKWFKFDSNGRRTELRPKAVTFTSVNTGTDQATITAHGFETGQRGYLTTTGALPTGLSTNTAYYLIVIDANTVRFAASLADALAGTPFVDITATGSGTHTFRIRSLSTPMGSTALTRAQSIVFNNKLIMVTSGVGNYPILFDPILDTDEYYDLAPQAPDADMVSEHLSRLWMNDKLDSDLLHYSSTFDHTKWLGLDDSGGLPTTPGDGDPVGITCIFPSFKQTLFVTKKRKTYKVVGYAPEEFQILPVSDGIGGEGPKVASTVGLDDVYYISQRGVHSVATTDKYGDFDGAYLSAKIKPTFDSWDKPSLKKVSTVYVPDLNSVAMNITAEDADNPSELWLYNIEQKEWYRWPDIEAVSLAVYQASDERSKLMWTTLDGKINIAQNSESVDFSSTAIDFRIRTGQIYPDGNPQSWKHFKKLTLMYKPLGRFSFTVKIWIDNLPVQSFSFSQSIQGDLLGTTFILGQSVLGSSAVFAPYTVDIEGHGRGLQFEVRNDNVDEQVAIYGYSIEYEPADYSQETSE